MVEQEHDLFHINNPLHLPGEEGHECDGLNGQHSLMCVMGDLDILGVQYMGMLSKVEN